MLAFFGWLLLATLLVRPYAGDFKDVFGKWAFVLLLPLAYSQRLDEAAVRRAIAVLGAVTLAFIPFFLRGYFSPVVNRAIALSGGGPNLGSIMMMAAVACTAWVLAPRPQTGRERAPWLPLCGAALFAAVLVLSLNRGALLGAAVALAWLAARRRPALLAAALFAGAVFLALQPHSRVVERLRSVVQWHESFTSQERVHMWVSGQAMVRDRPLLGFASRRNFIVWYSTHYRDPFVVETVPGHVHNAFLQTAILHGIPGLGLLCWLLVCLWRRGDGGSPDLSVALQPMLLAVLVNSQVDFVLADGQRAMMFYTLSGLLLGARKK